MISKLTLSDFRNHISSRIIIGAAKNIIITGDNGSGKTAILEAVSILSGERGLRTAPMTDIARFGGSGGFSVFADLFDDTQLSISFTNGDTNRRARIDSDAATLSDLASHLRIVWLTPREDRLFLESAGDRRAFFDRLVSGFDTTHSGRTVRLSKLLSERAFAIKSGSDNNWMCALESQIAGTAVSIAAARIKYAGEINYFLKNIAISVSGQLETALLSESAGVVETNYLKYLGENRCLVGDKMVIDGAHKSDFGVFNHVLNLPANLTSTGQQKSSLIDLILAHAKLIRTRTGKKPLILLDEATAHLDASARTRVFDELGAVDAQVWATGITRDQFDGVVDALFVSCQGGVASFIMG